jgi:hypothetical protein
MCSQENYIDRLAFSVNFSNCQFGFPVLEYYLVCKSTFAHLAYFNSDKNYVETYIYWVLGEITVMPHKKFQDLNINKSYFCKSDTNRRNFNLRSRYKNLFNVLNYIIYGVKA